VSSESVTLTQTECRLVGLNTSSVSLAPSRSQVSALLELFIRSERPLPQALADWESRVNYWCADYSEQNAGAEISEICLDVAVYLFEAPRYLVWVAKSSFPATR
jgi:hypothetical protein